MGGGPYYVALGGSRILSSDRTDQSGADDADVTDWTKTNDIILAVNINSGGKDTEAAQYKLRWRDETDNPGGAFSDLDSTGECKFGATNLVNGTNIAVGGRKCDSQGNDTWQAGEEVEGVKLSDSIDLPDEYETEVHFSVSLADGGNSHQYTFDLYDSTRGAQVGVLGAQITLAAGATTYYQNTGQAAMTFTQALSKKGFKDTGGYAIVIEGILNAGKLSLQVVGGYAMTMVGSLSRVTTFYRVVGNHAMTIIGNVVPNKLGGAVTSVIKKLLLLGVGK